MTDLETRLRELPARLDGLHADDRLADVVRLRGRQTRRRRAVVAGCAVAVLALLAGGAVATGTMRAQPAPPPAATVPTDRQLLTWPVRGSLAHDPEAARTALRAATADYRAPAGTPRLLWLGSAGSTADGDSRFAVTQEYRPGARAGLYLDWLSASGSNRWHSMGSIRVDPTAPAVGFVWPVDPTCMGSRGLGGAPSPCGSRTVGLLVLGAPDVRTVEYRLTGSAAAQATATDGVLIRTARVLVGPSGPYLVSASVVVTRSDGRRQAAAPGFPALVTVPAQSPDAVDWTARGLPPLLDAPETFPGLDLWGRLHGLPGRPGYASPVWGGTLADGSRAVIAQPMTGGGGPDHLVFAVNPPPVSDTKDTFLVRDLANPSDPRTVRQLSAFLPLSDGRCELVVVGEPGTTGVRYAADGSSFADLPVADGVGTLVLPSCAGHGQARIAVRAGGTETYRGPVDSTLPGGGVKHG